MHKYFKPHPFNMTSQTVQKTVILAAKKLQNFSHKNQLDTDLQYTLRGQWSPVVGHQVEVSLHHTLEYHVYTCIVCLLEYLLIIYVSMIIDDKSKKLNSM